MSARSFIDTPPSSRSYRRVKAPLSAKRGIMAFAIAAALGLPTVFEQTWQNGITSVAVTILNLPGILLGLFHGRYFPPEGFPGQSPIHAAAIILAQTVLWYLVISLVHVIRRRRATSNRAMQP